MTELELLKRRLERERAARFQAEKILEQKALELYLANERLVSLNSELEKRVEYRTQDLEASETRLSALITNLHAGVLVEDENRHITLTNQRFCNLLEIPYHPTELVGMDCSNSAEQSMHLFADPELFVSRIKEILEKRQPVIDEVLKMADGRILERDYIPIIFQNKYLGHLWQYRDVTSERYTSDALRRSEEKYRGIIENMDLGLLEVDLNEKIMKAYPRFCEMVGYEPDELIGKNALEVLLPKEFAPLMDEQKHVRATGQPGVYEVPMIKKNRERIWALISGAPIFDLDGKVIGSVGIHYDITYQKNLQRELEAARLRAEEAQEAEKQFLANISHEIRTPLNAIIGMSHLLYDTNPSEEQREYLDILRTSSEMLRMLISDVLDLAKVRSGKLEINENEFDLAGLLRTLVKSLQLRLDDRPVSVTAQIDPRLNSLVTGDDLALNQIMLNLLGNAEKFTENGAILLEAKLAEPPAGAVNLPPNANRIWVEMRVSDTGIGIPPEKHDLIFQTFRQVDGDIKRKFGGTGLGLAITKQLVDRMNGSIRVESDLGKGSAFIVVLPYINTGKALDMVAGEEASGGALVTAGKRVLVVEDNYMNRKYIGNLLKKWQINFKFAMNGVEGFEAARQEAFDLILMDIQMPEMDGYECAIAIRESSNLNQKTPILALTASAMVSQKSRAFKAGMNDYLSKPFNPNQLYQKLQDLIHYENLTPQIEGIPGVDLHPSLDGAQLANLYGDDIDYIREMFEIFLETIDPEFDQMRAAVAAENWDALAKLSHKNKTAFGMIGLPEIERQMQELEHSIKQHRREGTYAQMFHDIDAQLPDAKAAVAQTFQSIKNA